MRFVNIGLGLILLLGLGLISCSSLFPNLPGSLTQPAEATSAAPKAINSTLNLRQYLPYMIKWTPTAPLYSTSYYMLTINATTLYNMGCKIGQGDAALPGSRDTVVVLDFGSPKKINGEYGADLFWMGPVTISQITSAVKNFGQGYYNCVGPDTGSQIFVAVGTTNYPTSTTISNTTDFYNHGAAWATMINDINSWYISQGYSSQVIAVGADDIELSWNTPTVSKAWVNGYNSTHNYDWYDFGTLDGCATRSYISSTCGNGWTRDDAYYVAYGTFPAWPLPEIYLNNGLNAQQWAMLSQYSYTTRGFPFVFMGSFTQYQACIQSPGQCTGVDNTPSTGWTQLFNQLSVSQATYMVPKWSSDIKWWDGTVTVPTTPKSLPQIVSPTAQPAQASGLYSDLADSLTNSLSNPGLSPDSQALLQGKLAGVQAMLKLKQQAIQATPAAKNPGEPKYLPKTIDPQFQTGIFEGGGGTFHSWEGQFNNHWQGVVNGQYVFVSAGAAADDPSKGIVMIMTVSDDRLTVHKASYTAPNASGSLQVQQVEWPQVTLDSSTGQTIVFDASTQTFH